MLMTLTLTVWPVWLSIYIYVHGWYVRSAKEKRCRTDSSRDVGDVEFRCTLVLQLTETGHSKEFATVWSLDESWWGARRTLDTSARKLSTDWRNLRLDDLTSTWVSGNVQHGAGTGLAAEVYPWCSSRDGWLRSEAWWFNFMLINKLAKCQKGVWCRLN